MSEADAALRDLPPAEFAKFLMQKLSSGQPMPLRPQDAALLEGAQAFRFGPDDSRCAWSLGEGPLVLMIHGWGGRGVQMAPLARTLALAGFRCVFFDAGGHGDSRREPIGFDLFINDAGALTKHVAEPVFAWIGHSAGGLGMMAARATRGLEAERYVCIAAPLFPYVPIATIKQKFAPSEEVIELVKGALAAQFETSWPALEAGRVFEPGFARSSGTRDGDERNGHARDARKLLVAFDVDDERVRHADAERIAEIWPGARIVKTEKFGHNKLLQSPEVLTQTLAFLKEGASAH
jgi:pimeloyl-ACP methyl ester carboxylesterase